MRTRSFCFVPVVYLLAWTGLDLPAQTPPPPTATPSATNASTATPTDIPLGEVVSRAETTTTDLRGIDAALAADQTLPQLDEGLAPITQRIDNRLAEDIPLLQAGSSVAILQASQKAWQMLADDLATVKTSLTDAVTQDDAKIAHLRQSSANWQATLGQAQAKNSGTPPEIIQRIQAIVAAIDKTTQSLKAHRAQLLGAQDRVAAQDARISQEQTAINKAQESAVARLFIASDPPLWGVGLSNPTTNPGQEVYGSLATQMKAAKTYAFEKRTTFGVQFLIFLALAAMLYRVRREIHLRVGEEPALRHAAQILNLPFATAAVLALLAGIWIYPLAPRLFVAILGAAALFPAVAILRQLIVPSLFPILYALVVSYFLDQVRHVAASSPVAARLLLLGQLLGGLCFLGWLLWTMRFSPPQTRDRLEKIVRIFARLAALVLLVAFFSAVLGYVPLANLLTDTTLSSAYIAVILYAAVRIADGLLMSALRLRPFSRLGMVQRHYELLCRKLFRLFRWLATLLWLALTLDKISLRESLYQEMTDLLMATVTIKFLDLTLGPLSHWLACGLVIWLAFLLSRFIRFSLEEEIYPHLRLPAGVPYAISTMVHYVILVIGVLAALTALHVDMSQFSILVGAIGVGLGFGLQNIMNNFVSGIILLFERPIKIGDVIQVDTGVGTVERIGIRASVIRINNGAEVIIPNGNLIANQVTNWTFSNRQRRVDITISVPARTDSGKVIKLMTDTAAAHALVSQNPPPQALLSSMTAAALTFELHAWTNNYDDWMNLRSDLALSINMALTKEGITVS